MKPVTQTTFGDGKGNCFTACVASILELPIDAVPNFCVDYGEGEWWIELEKWLAPRALAPLLFCVNKGEQADRDAVWAFFDGEHGFYAHRSVPVIVSGKNEHGVAHSIVSYWDADAEAIATHDPNPRSTGLVSFRDIIAFAALRPHLAVTPLTSAEMASGETRL